MANILDILTATHLALRFLELVNALLSRTHIDVLTSLNYIVNSKELIMNELKKTNPPIREFALAYIAIEKTA